MVLSMVTLDSMYFLMVSICLPFFFHVGFSQWQDTSSCNYGEVECVGNDGYMCANGYTCISCGVLAYNYDCNDCRCEIGSLAFILLCVVMMLIIIGSSIYCCKEECLACCCCRWWNEYNSNRIAKAGGQSRSQRSGVTEG